MLYNSFMVGGEEGQTVYTEKIQRASRLNQAFKNGKEGWEVLDDLKAIEKPILLDFNNVLANNRPPLIPNPEGSGFVQELSKAGDVIIATTARDWNFVHDFLSDNGMWNDEIVLMTSDTWSFLSSSFETWGESKEAKERLLAAYQGHLKSRGIEVSEMDLKAVAAMKPLAPLFNKPFDIPLIDDLYMATFRPYPGTLGIDVKAFYDEEEKKSYDDERGLPFPEVINRVRGHYSNINPSQT